MGTNRNLRFGILTSSRADFGIYLPLLKKFRAHDSLVDFEIIAFGSHFSTFHGLTKNEIERHGFEIKHELNSMLLTDDEESVSTSYGLTGVKFSHFWRINSPRFDGVFCLGDRFEMAAAVFSGIPFNIKFIHIHGGETTLGAIDNIYRHSITLASSLHFVSAEPFQSRIRQLCGEGASCFVSGALSLDGIDIAGGLSKNQFLEKWNIDISEDFALITIHPETVSPSQNNAHAEVMRRVCVLLQETMKLVVTLPNVDTNGTKYRQMFHELQRQMPSNITLIENFGKESYFTAMRHCKFLLGNSSSGIIEAASFGKYAINVGDRQKGRLRNQNVINVPFDVDKIIETIGLLPTSGYTGSNLYKTGEAAQTIFEKTIQYFND